MVKRIQIKSKFKNYTVHFEDNLKNIIPTDSNNIFFLIDKKIFTYHSDINQYLKNNKKIVTINANEEAKSFISLQKVLRKLVKLKISKKSKLIVIGGGVTQDIGSFIASILFRGIEWQFLPTTLLAQGDSCIGSKTSINFEGLKNQIGTFFPPTKIFIIKKFLSSLKKKDINSGLGEMSHYFLIGGRSKFLILKKELNKKKINYQKLIFESLKIKKKFIEKDEFDIGLRIILNYGHTFGHAIESVSKYRIPHGIAVTFGIDIINYIALQKGLMDYKTFRNISELLKVINNRYEINNLDKNKIFSAIKKDKKNSNDIINLVFSKNLNSMTVKKTIINQNLFNQYKGYFIQ